MKKVVGLCMVILLSSVSLSAREHRRADRTEKDRDPSKRIECIATELKLDEKQKAEFQKINEKYAAEAKAEREKMQAEREKQRDAMKAEREKQREKMLAVREQRNAEVQKILSDEQYQQYLEKQKSRGDKEKMKGQKSHHRKGDRRK